MARMDAGYVGAHANHELLRKTPSGHRDPTFDVPRVTIPDRRVPGLLSTATRPTTNPKWRLAGNVRFWIGSPYWDAGMDDAYHHMPSQHHDPLRAMEHQCRWMCTQPRQNLRSSFDKAKFYKFKANYEDTALNRRTDAGERRTRALERFSYRLWNGPVRKQPRASWNSGDVERLLARLGLLATYRADGLPAIGRHIGVTRRQLEVFTLYRAFTQEQIAAELGITQAAVSFRLTAATGRCRQWVTKQNLIPVHLSLVDAALAPLSPAGPGGIDGPQSKSELAKAPLLRFLCALMDRAPVPTSQPIGSEVPFVPWQGEPLPWVRERQAQLTGPLRVLGHRAAVLILLTLPVLRHHFVVWPDFQNIAS